MLLINQHMKNRNVFGKPLDLGPIIGQLDFHDSLHLKSAQTMSWPFNRANLFVNALLVYVFHSLSIRENTNIFCGSKVLACPGIGNTRTHNEGTFAQTNAIFCKQTHFQNVDSWQGTEIGFKLFVTN